MNDEIITNTGQKPQEQAKTVLFSSGDVETQAETLENAGFKMQMGQQQKAEITEAQAKNPIIDDSIIDNIVKQSTETEKTEQVLDDLEQMGQNLDLNLEDTPESKKIRKMAQTMFVLAFIASIFIFSFFYLNSKDMLGFVGIKKIDLISVSTQSVNSLKTEKVVNNYLTAALAVQKLATLSINSGVDKTVFTEIRKTLEIAKKELNETVAEFKDNVNVEATVVQSINNKIANLQDGPDKTLYLDAQKLLADKTIQAKLEALDLAKLTEQELENTCDDIFAIVQNSTLEKITIAQSRRIIWTGVISVLESITKTIDPTFSVFSPSKDAIVTLNSYQLDSTARTIGASGTVRTKNPETFSLIANYRDSLEASPLFEGTSYRSYSKNLGEDGFYTGSINLQFSIESKYAGL